MFKLALQHIAGNDLSNGIFMKSENSLVEMTSDLRSEFLEKFEVVFVDNSGALNLASRVSTSALDELKREVLFM